MLPPVIKLTWVEHSSGSEPMILQYESDSMDVEDARGRFYHVCRGRVQETELAIPAPGQPYECPVCESDLEVEDFLLAQERGWA